MNNKVLIDRDLFLDTCMLLINLSFDYDDLSFLYNHNQELFRKVYDQYLEKLRALVAHDSFHL